MKKTNSLKSMIAGLIAVLAVNAQASSADYNPNLSGSTVKSNIDGMEVEISDAKQPISIVLNKVTDCSSDSCSVYDISGKLRFLLVAGSSSDINYITSGASKFKVSGSENTKMQLRLAVTSASAACPVEVKINRNAFVGDSVKLDGNLSYASKCQTLNLNFDKSFSVVIDSRNDCGLGTCFGYNSAKELKLKLWTNRNRVWFTTGNSLDVAVLITDQQYSYLKSVILGVSKACPVELILKLNKDGVFIIEKIKTKCDPLALGLETIQAG